MRVCVFVCVCVYVCVCVLRFDNLTGRLLFSHVSSGYVVCVHQNVLHIFMFVSCISLCCGARARSCGYLLLCIPLKLSSCVHMHAHITITHDARAHTYTGAHTYTTRTHTHAHTHTLTRASEAPARVSGLLGIKRNGEGRRGPAKRQPE